jgi:hypothetical protein
VGPGQVPPLATGISGSEMTKKFRFFGFVGSHVGIMRSCFNRISTVFGMLLGLENPLLAI